MSQFSPRQSQGKAIDLFQIAADQRTVILCALTEFTMLVACISSREHSFSSFSTSLLYLLVMVVAMVYVFKLATAIYNPGIGFVLGLLTMIPLVGLIVLLVMSSRAITVLRKNGVSMGFLGTAGTSAQTASAA